MNRLPSKGIDKINYVMWPAGLYIYNIACADMLTIGTSTPELADRDDERVANFNVVVAQSVVLIGTSLFLCVTGHTNLRERRLATEYSGKQARITDCHPTSTIIADPYVGRNLFPARSTSP